MEFKLDPHVHIDFDRARNIWHGVPPKVLAGALMRSDLDGVATTNHYKPSKRFPELLDELAKLQEIERARKGVTKEILILLGLEATVSYMGAKYHLGHIFEKDFDEREKPNIPRCGCDIREFIAFAREYPGVTILNHPGYGSYGDEDALHRAYEITQIPEIKGVEILNGRVPGGKHFTDSLFSWASNSRPNLAAIGGGDIHYGEQYSIGEIYTGVDVQKSSGKITREDVIMAMVQGRTRAIREAGETGEEMVREL